jgi:uncharacterized protein YhbP (UPF0306 family)
VDAHPDDVTIRALNYLDNRHCMSIATHGPEGLWAATVFYVNAGFTLYFLSLSNTRHVRNIEADPHVAATLSDEGETWPEIRGVQLEGTVARVESADEYRRVMDLFGQRYPFARTSLWWSDMPRDLVAEQRLYRVEPSRVLFVDHGFRSARSAIETEQLHSMTESARNEGEELKKDLEALETLRDEMRVRVHLARMEVQVRWNELQPRIDDLLDSAKRLGEASLAAVKEALELAGELRKAV